MKYNYIKNNSLILFFVTSILLLGLFISFTTTNWFKQRQIEESVKHEIEEVHRLLPVMQESGAMLMAGQLDFLLADQRLKEAWMAKDRAGLMQLAMPMFENMRAKYAITHFYFIDNNSSCFLRVHNPSRYGDTIKRATMDNAVRFGNLSYGMELGPFGTYTLRAVHPWYINNKLEGYLELGINFDHITSRLKDILSVELIVTVNKKLIEQIKWEEGRKALGRTGDWVQISDGIIIEKTLRTIPAELVSLMSDSQERKSRTIPKIKIEGRDYRGGRVNLEDSSGDYVGDIYLLKDITDLENSWITLLIIQTLSSSLMYLLMLYFITSFGMGVTARKMIHTIDNRLRILGTEEKTSQEQGLNQNNTFQPKDNPLATVPADKIIRFRADVNSALNSKQLGLFEILEQDEKTYEEILEIAQSKNLGISNIEALRVQIFRLDKKLEQETVFKIDRKRRNGILFFNIPSVGQDAT